MVWIYEHVYASKIESLFEKEALKDINEENAHEAINSVFNKVCEKPDLLFQNFDPSFIYYKKIDVCRFLHEDDGSKIQIRVGDFQYLILTLLMQHLELKIVEPIFLTEMI